MALKDIFDLAKDIAKDKLSTKITAGAALVGALGAYAAGVDPALVNFAIGGGAALATKAVTGYGSVAYQELKKLNIAS